MDGLVVILIVGWIISSFLKKGKGKTVENQKQKSSQIHQAHRAEYASKLRAELEKRKLELSSAREGAFAIETMAEGEGNSNSGSMLFDSNEGECICEPELEHDRQMVSEPESVYAGQIGSEPLIDFSAKGVLQGFVMSEILNRPSQRPGRVR